MKKVSFLVSYFILLLIYRRIFLPFCHDIVQKSFHALILPNSYSTSPSWTTRFRSLIFDFGSLSTGNAWQSLQVSFFF
jgi:hypothetical protein